MIGDCYTKWNEVNVRKSYINFYVEISIANVMIFLDYIIGNWNSPLWVVVKMYV